MKTNECIKSGLLSLVFLLAFHLCSVAQQLIPQGGLSGQQLANVLTGSGVTLSNVSLTCPTSGSGSFSTGGASNTLGINNGILLTSGCISVAVGPNNNTEAECRHNAPGDADLAALVTSGGTQNFDACVLEFDLVPIGDLVTFKYVFASEEYGPIMGQYFCSNFNDVFAFFVTGPNPNSPTPYNKKNIALVPGTTTPVSINNVGPTFCSLSGLDNHQFYRDNPPGSVMLQYDGMTTVLEARVAMVPCQKYHFKLGVMDVGDDKLDSGVFIEAGSFNSNAILASCTPVPPKCPGGCDGAINLTTSGGKPPYAFKWSTNATSQNISGLCAGTYTVSITDANNCLEVKSCTVTDGIDSQAPVVKCPAVVDMGNDNGQCGAKVTFSATATDNCTTNPSVICVPGSGSTFAVGTTPVVCTAKDNSGNVSTCQFTVTIRDKEAPKITCPANLTQNCDLPTTPNITGIPITSDNCQVGQVSSTDLVTKGNCPGNYTITRTWNVSDIYTNTNSCKQTITVQDITPPALTCPPPVTVTCDTTPAATGVAVALDNCDPSPALSHTNQTTNGDCLWLCTIERTWLTVDNCGNSRKCVQKIVKNVLPLLEEALSKDLNGDGKTDTLVLGVPTSTLAIPPGTGNCIQLWLPSSGTVPSGIAFGTPTPIVGANCLPGKNPLDVNRHLENPLLAEALQLNIMARLKPTFGTTKLSALNCTIAPIVLAALAPNPDVNELIRVTNTALGNVQLQPHLNELLAALRCLNTLVDPCK